MKKILNKAVLFFLCASLLVTSALFVGCDKQDEKKGREVLSTNLYGQTFLNDTDVGEGEYHISILWDNAYDKDIKIVVTDDGVFTFYENETVFVPSFKVGRFVEKRFYRNEKHREITVTTYVFEIDYIEEQGAIKTIEVAVCKGGKINNNRVYFRV